MTAPGTWGDIFEGRWFSASPSLCYVLLLAETDEPLLLSGRRTDLPTSDTAAQRSRARWRGAGALRKRRKRLRGLPRASVHLAG
jgi:hypothetical protein